VDQCCFHSIGAAVGIDDQGTLWNDDSDGDDKRGVIRALSGMMIVIVMIREE
jgi:hypothetical protein